MITLSKAQINRLKFILSKRIVYMVDMSPNKLGPYYKCITIQL